MSVVSVLKNSHPLITALRLLAEAGRHHAIGPGCGDSIGGDPNILLPDTLQLKASRAVSQAAAGQFLRRKLHQFGLYRRGLGERTAANTAGLGERFTGNGNEDRSTSNRRIIETFLWRRIRTEPNITEPSRHYPSRRRELLSKPARTLCLIRRHPAAKPGICRRIEQGVDLLLRKMSCYPWITAQQIAE